MAVRVRGKILYIDFYCYLPDGRRVRCVESTRLVDNKKNRKIADSKNKAIQYELKYGRFEYLRLFPHGSKAKYFEDAIATCREKGWSTSFDIAGELLRATKEERDKIWAGMTQQLIPYYQYRVKQLLDPNEVGDSSFTYAVLKEPPEQ